MIALKDKDDIVGKLFTNLTVIKYLDSASRLVEAKDRKRYTHYYLCKCSCGNEKISTRLSLLTNNTKSCGCLTIIRNKSKSKGLSTLYNNLYNQNKANSKRRNILFEIDKETHYKLVIDRCHYCNHSGRNTFKSINSNLFINYNGIDRIDSGIGYINTNVVTCCYICNRAKMNMNYLDFIEYLKEVSINVYK